MGINKIYYMKNYKLLLTSSIAIIHGMLLAHWYFISGFTEWRMMIFTTLISYYLYLKERE